MQKHVHDLQNILLIRELDEFKIRATQLIQAAGFTNHMYAFAQPGEGGLRKNGFAAEFTDFPSEWMSRYVRNRYFEIDPVVNYCDVIHFRPLLWSPDHKSGAVASFVEEASSYGMLAGVCFPMRDKHGRQGGWSLALNSNNKESNAFLQSELPWTNLLCVYLHDAFQRLNSPPSAEAEAIDLSVREVECLKWCAAGKTAWEVGRILNISEWTVTYHLRNIKRKLGVGSRPQIVARAISLGLIKP